MSGQAAGRHAERRERVDDELLDVAHVLGRTERVRHVDDRIADELPGTVVRDVAAPPDGHEVGADSGRVATQVVGEVGPRSVREHVGVLEQQQVLFSPVIEQRLLDGQRLPVRDRAEPADTERRRHASLRRASERQ